MLHIKLSACASFLCACIISVGLVCHNEESSFQVFSSLETLNLKPDEVAWGTSIIIMTTYKV